MSIHIDGVIEGLVEHGDARGRLLGFPTANLPMPTGTESDNSGYDGVWAGRVIVADLGTWQATVSVGSRPTYYTADSVRLAEAHLLGFTGDLYGRRIRVELIHRLRGQVACASSAELVELIRDDVLRTRSLLGTEPDAIGAPVRSSHSPVTSATAPPPRPPQWALQRVASDCAGTHGADAREVAAIARSTGLSRRLVRRCLRHLLTTADHSVASFHTDDPEAALVAQRR